ncbi:hypothetical protein [Paralimibaculum aggregatum]|uniref:hypothetical protein n=1 Tax=Paralimibaculum aggregatum TaxID=3036245 RepID=UPI003322A853
MRSLLDYLRFVRRTAMQGGRGGVEVAQGVLAETQTAVLPLVPHAVMREREQARACGSPP